jgi:hypothetical protein
MQWVHTALGFGGHSPRASPGIPILFFHARRTGLLLTHYRRSMALLVSASAWCNRQHRQHEERPFSMVYRIGGDTDVRRRSSRPKLLSMFVLVSE